MGTQRRNISISRADVSLIYLGLGCNEPIYIVKVRKYLLSLLPPMNPLYACPWAICHHARTILINWCIALVLQLKVSSILLLETPFSEIPSRLIGTTYMLSLLKQYPGMNQFTLWWQSTRYAISLLGIFLVEPAKSFSFSPYYSINGKIKKWSNGIDPNRS